MPSLINLLKDVDVKAISLVPGGANQQRIFLMKCNGFDCPAGVNEMPTGRIVKADGDDWSSFYIVVAEPGAEEKPGLHGDQSTRDVWADEDEIRKAAHRFMRNGGLINKLHQDMEPYGQLVENAIAHQDFTVDGHTIKKGSWYIAVEPTDEGRRLINSGELGGVSIQGLGIRQPMEKGALERVPGVQNWIERLPAAMRAAWNRSIVYRAAVHIAPKMGSVGHAIASALNWADHICHTGDVKQWPGPQEVRPSSVAECCAAIALWESMKAAAKADNVAKAGAVTSDDVIEVLAKAEQLPDDTLLPAESEKIEGVEQEGLLRRVAKSLGIEPEIDDSGYIDLIKRDFSQDKRKQLASQGKALSDGSYPIENCGDVSNAVQAIGRGSASASTIKSHIIKRARALGCTGQLPDSWGLQKDGGTVEPTQEEDVELSERVEQIEKDVKEQGEKIDALTGDESPIMKGLQDLRIKFDERESKPADGDKDDEKKPSKSKDGDGDDSESLSKADAEKLREQLEDVAEQQGVIAESLLKINSKVEASLAGDSSQQEAHEQHEQVTKSNGRSPLSGLLS